jgi:hypothetical protein
MISNCAGPIEVLPLITKSTLTISATQDVSTTASNQSCSTGCNSVSTSVGAAAASKDWTRILESVAFTLGALQFTMYQDGCCGEYQFTSSNVFLNAVGAGTKTDTVIISGCFGGNGTTAFTDNVTIQGSWGLAFRPDPDNPGQWQAQITVSGSVVGDPSGGFEFSAELLSATSDWFPVNELMGAHTFTSDPIAPTNRIAENCGTAPAYTIAQTDGGTMTVTLTFA